MPSVSASQSDRRTEHFSSTGGDNGARRQNGVGGSSNRSSTAANRNRTGSAFNASSAASSSTFAASSPSNIPATRPLYQVLEIPTNASQADVRKAYRRMALRYHPDKAGEDNAEAAEKFQQVLAAYTLLSDTEAREIYDRYGEQGLTNIESVPVMAEVAHMMCAVLFFRVTFAVSAVLCSLGFSFILLVAIKVDYQKEEWSWNTIAIPLYISLGMMFLITVISMYLRVRKYRMWYAEAKKMGGGCGASSPLGNSKGASSPCSAFKARRPSGLGSPCGGGGMGGNPAAFNNASSSCRMHSNSGIPVSPTTAGGGGGGGPNVPPTSPLCCGGCGTCGPCTLGNLMACRATRAFFPAAMAANEGASIGTPTVPANTNAANNNTNNADEATSAFAPATPTTPSASTTDYYRFNKQACQVNKCLILQQVTFWVRHIAILCFLLSCAMLAEILQKELHNEKSVMSWWAVFGPLMVASLLSVANVGHFRDVLRLRGVHEMCTWMLGFLNILGFVMFGLRIIQVVILPLRLTNQIEWRPILIGLPSIVYMAVRCVAAICVEISRVRGLNKFRERQNGGGFQPCGTTNLSTGLKTKGCSAAPPPPTGASGAAGGDGGAEESPQHEDATAFGASSTASPSSSSSSPPSSSWSSYLQPSFIIQVSLEVVLHALVIASIVMCVMKANGSAISMSVCLAPLYTLFAILVIISATLYSCFAIYVSTVRQQEKARQKEEDLAELARRQEACERRRRQQEQQNFSPQGPFFGGAGHTADGGGGNGFARSGGGGSSVGGRPRHYNFTSGGVGSTAMGGVGGGPIRFYAARQDGGRVGGAAAQNALHRRHHHHDGHQYTVDAGISPRTPHGGRDNGDDGDGFPQHYSDEEGDGDNHHGHSSYRGAAAAGGADEYVDYAKYDDDYNDDGNHNGRGDVGADGYGYVADDRGDTAAVEMTPMLDKAHGNGGVEEEEGHGAEDDGMDGDHQHYHDDGDASVPADLYGYGYDAAAAPAIDAFASSYNHRPASPTVHGQGEAYLHHRGGVVNGGADSPNAHRQQQQQQQLSSSSSVNPIIVVAGGPSSASALYSQHQQQPIAPPHQFGHSNTNSNMVSRLSTPHSSPRPSFVNRGAAGAGAGGAGGVMSVYGRGDRLSASNRGFGLSTMMSGVFGANSGGGSAVAGGSSGGGGGGDPSLFGIGMGLRGGLQHSDNHPLHNHQHAPSSAAPLYDHQHAHYDDDTENNGYVDAAAYAANAEQQQQQNEYDSAIRIDVVGHRRHDDAYNNNNPTFSSSGVSPLTPAAGPSGHRVS